MVLISLLLCSPQPEYKVADPICTFLFSVLVLGTTLPVTKEVFRILMEGKQHVATVCLNEVIVKMAAVCDSGSRLCFLQVPLRTSI